MKYSTRRFIAIALSMALAGNSVPAYPAVIGKANYVAPNIPAPVSGKLIVKFKANNLPTGLSVAQINSRLIQPLSAQTVLQMQAAAGTGLSELHAISSGAHVLSLAGQANRQVIDTAITGIRALPGVEYVEEDQILTPQAIPNDAYYTSAVSGGITYPGLWGMWPISAVAGTAPGATGSYGADFQTAWNTVTGAGVVVAVVDTGITPNVDIVGAGGTVAAGAGSNLVSTGYDFITDCRVRATCAAATLSASAVVAASPNATDLGNFITAQDKIDNPNWATATVANSDWHGTHVAGIVAALGNNAAGVIGGAYNAKILPVRALGKGGGSLSDIAEAIKWAAGVHPSLSNPNPAKVINLSLGGGSASCSATMQNAVNAAVAAGAVVVVAAGNSNLDVANFTPANCTNVISVAAVGRDGSRASYSNFSSPASNTTNPVNITVAAQGGDQTYAAAFDPGILSTLNTGTTTPVLTGGSGYAWYQGTSMATPYVAAAAALMLAKNPALTPAQIKTILASTASLTAFPSFVAGMATWDCSLKQNCGAGILNANLAVQNSTPVVSAVATTDFGSVVMNGTLSKTVTLTNTSGFSAQLGTASLSNLLVFAIGSDTCSGTTLAPNATCQIAVSYAPTGTGAHTASLTVPVTGAASATIVGLTGTSVVQLTTSDVTAPTVTIGNSTTVNLSYTNINAGAVTVGALSLSQPAIMAASTDHCSNATLAGGASCTVTVTVTPATVGAYSGTASLGVPGGTAAVATISGTANAVAAARSGGGGGGGCSIMPFGALPDASLLLAILAVAAYWLRRRVVYSRSAD